MFLPLIAKLCLRFYCCCSARCGYRCPGILLACLIIAATRQMRCHKATPRTPSFRTWEGHALNPSNFVRQKMSRSDGGHSIWEMIGRSQKASIPGLHQSRPPRLATSGRSFFLLSMILRHRLNRLHLREDALIDDRAGMMFDTASLRSAHVRWHRK